MRISDWSADVCSSDLRDRGRRVVRFRTRKSGHLEVRRAAGGGYELDLPAWRPSPKPLAKIAAAMGGSPLDPLWHDGGYSVIVYPDEAAIHALSPAFRALRSMGDIRSDERSGGKEGGSTCRSRG